MTYGPRSLTNAAARADSDRAKFRKLSSSLGIIRANIEAGSTLHTDEHGGYRGLGAGGEDDEPPEFQHETVNHSAGEFVRDGVSTNGIESVWAVLKRGVYGTFHHVSAKHLGRYLDEFTFRLNEGNVKRHTLQRLESFVDGTAGRRLTYKDLIG